MELCFDDVRQPFFQESIASLVEPQIVTLYINESCAFRCREVLFVEMRRTHVIITVPHGKCPDDEEVSGRFCDERADEAASALSALLPTASVYRAPTYRSEGDLNRPETRNTEWRRAIQAEVQRHVANGYHVILFDMHSFPNTSSSFGVTHEHSVPQLVLLDEPSLPHAALAGQIASTTSVQQVAVHIGSEINDITVQARAVGHVDAMLWEFNESPARLSHAQIVEVANVLASYASIAE